MSQCEKYSLSRIKYNYYITTTLRQEIVRLISITGWCLAFNAKAEILLCYYDFPMLPNAVSLPCVYANNIYSVMHLNLNAFLCTLIYD
jgi:hypothetical protein